MRVRLGDVCDRGTSNLKQSDITDTSGEYPVYGASGLIGTVSFYHQKLPYVAVVKDGAGIGRTTLHPAESSVIGTMQYLLPKANILPEYLYYVVKHMHLEKYYTGATIPHIYFKDYKSEEFNLEPLEKQHIIVDMLEKIESVIEARQKELKRLDDLIKSRFIEMFGIINEEVPLSYYIASLNAGKSLASEEESTNKVLKTGAVTYDYFDATQTKNLPRDYEPQENHRVNAGDVIISRMNTAELVGAAAYVWNVPEHIYLPDRLWKAEIKGTANPIFLWQVLIQSSTKENIRRIASGTSGSMKNISKLGLIEIRVVKAPIELQNQFAAFVQQVDKSKLLEWINLAKKSFDLLHERICNGRHFI